jgi:uncharacterized protein
VIMTRLPRKARPLIVGLVCVSVLVGGCTSSGPHASSSTGASTPATSSPAPISTAAGTPSAQPSPPVSDEAGKLPTFPTPPPSPGLPTPTTTAQVRAFVTAVFNDAQSDWREVFEKAGIAYSPARLVLFASAVRTGCGTESSEVGPFYCPADRTVYLDVTFFDDLQRRYGVQGDFAQAYVVAHEVGHHIQNITGLSTQVAEAQARNPAQANALSVLTELQADCYAGVWAHSTYRRGLLEPGDLDEALTAAGAVGDDFLQSAATGTVHPEQWTHGSSAQRQHWLAVGYDGGDPASCNTFASG